MGLLRAALVWGVVFASSWVSLFERGGVALCWAQEEQRFEPERAAALLGAAPGEPAEPVEAVEAMNIEAGFLPGLLALVPGLLLHGSGVYAAGDSEAAWSLLAMEVAGLGGALAGVLGLWWTRASKKTVGPIITVAVSGVGLFVASWFADVVGSLGGGELGAVQRRTPWLELRTGYQFVHDPHFSHHSFWSLDGDWRLSQWRLSPSALVSLHEDQQRFRVLTAWRFFGPQPDTRSEHGSFVELELGSSYHRMPSAGFQTLSFDGSVLGRLDFGGLGRSLRGFFGELGAGWGMELYGYPGVDLGLGTDVVDMLLSRFRFGMVIGEEGHGQAELALSYDHRRDTLAGGLGLNDISSGAMGFFGFDASVILPEDQAGDAWSVHTRVELGSAWVAALQLGYRWAARTAP